MPARKDGVMPLVDLILDRGGQKGTSKWAAQDSFDLMDATPASAEVVHARVFSDTKDERIAAPVLIISTTSP
jgi:6-phosphogluconate dehydrogenase